MSAQPALFPLPGEPPPGRAARGWAALPQVVKTVELHEPGATGRKKLTFSYRHLPIWSPEQVAQAEQLIGLYFQHFGGFRLADQAVLRAWIEGLGLYTAEEIRWALRAKWQSLQSSNDAERRDKRRYIARPDKFPQTIGHWLQQAPEYQARLHREMEAQSRQRIDALNAARQRAAERACVRAAAAQAERRARDAELESQRRAFWDGLSAAQRRAAVQATESQFRAQCANYNRDPEDPQSDDLRCALAISWARLKWGLSGAPQETAP